MGGSTISVIIDGDDLLAVRVRGGVLGARGETIGRAESALGVGGGERLGALLRGAGSGRLILTVPSEWAAVRAISMTVAQWRDGADEVRRSVGGLLPLSSEDAMLGLIESSGVHGGGGGGYLVGVSASQVRPWIEAVERASGRRVDAVLTRHMAMLGIGLQEYDRADVLEGDGADDWGAMVRHRFASGLIDRLGESWSEGDTLADAAVVIGSQPTGVRGRVIGAEELAVGAALASRVAGESFVSLDAKPARGLGKWIMPIGALAAAAVLFVAGGMWHESRMERASARLDARMAQISADVDAASAVRGEALETMALIESAREAAGASRQKMLPLVTAALQSVPEGGFIYSMEVSRDRLLMRGETAQAGEVVRRLENSAEFEGARQVAPMNRSPNGGETFDVTADRTGTGSGGTAGTGGVNR